jgi:hypothetical protein
VVCCLAQSGSSLAIARTGVYWPGRTLHIPYNQERPKLIQRGFEPNPGTRFGLTFIAIGAQAPSTAFPGIAWSSWGEETAKGAGSAVLAGQTERGGPLEVESDRVEVELTMDGLAPRLSRSPWKLVAAAGM